MDGPDFSYRATRQQLVGQPVVLPAVTPYDGNERLRTVFLSGFKKGWDIALKYWLGNAIITPEEYAQSSEIEKTWDDGCNAGVEALCERVLSMRRRLHTDETTPAPVPEK